MDGLQHRSLWVVGTSSSNHKTAVTMVGYSAGAVEGMLLEISRECRRKSLRRAMWKGQGFLQAYMIHCLKKGDGLKVHTRKYNSLKNCSWIWPYSPVLIPMTCLTEQINLIHILFCFTSLHSLDSRDFVHIQMIRSILFAIFTRQ